MLRPNRSPVDDVWLVRYDGNSPLYVLKDSWIGVAPAVVDGLCDDTMCIRISKLNEGQTVLNDMQQRRHHRLLPGEYGLPLAEFGTIRELLTVFMDIIQAHTGLLEDASGILHRDINLRNIMIRDDAKPGQLSCLLIDLDYAVTYPRVHVPNVESPKAHRAGTLAFMSHDLLLYTTSSIAHQPYHDLQSFFCVLLWICVTMEGPGKHRLTNFAFATTVIGRWVASNDLTACGDVKKLHMISSSSFKKLVDQFHPYFNGLKPLVGMIRMLLFSFNPAEQEVASNTAVTHDKLLTILREDRDKLDGKDPAAPPEGGWSVD